MSTIKYGLIHCHSENSMKDSTLSVASLVKQAKKMGAPAVTLTDHGVVTGIFEFVRTAQEEGIKAIPGVEAYKREEGDIDNAHQILLAKDYVGWQAISRAVTASNANLHGDTPCMTMDILKNCFGPDAPGHGHVISTSACVGGILAKILRKNDSLAAKISKLETNTAAEETTQLQEKVTDVTIVPPESGNPAGAASSSDESGDAQVKIIEQQQSTIDALLARTEQLTKQLNMLVAQGVQITDETPNAQQQKASTEDDYVSLSDLGRSIGKPR